LRAVENYSERNFAGFLELQEAEQMALGGILLYPGRLAQIKSVLKPKDFRYEKHQLIYGALLNMDKQNIPIDVYSLWCFLEECGQLDSVGRGSYLTYLCEIA
jgi:replicative DNA helicase